MIEIPGLNPLEKIYESADSEVWRARRLQDDLPVIIKTLKGPDPSPEEIINYRREYEIAARLRGHPHIIEVHELITLGHTLAIIMEDFGGTSLDLLMSRRRFSINEALKLFPLMAAALEQIHADGVIHKDINPTNIVFNPEAGLLKIIDFGISSLLPREEAPRLDPRRVEGTLPYLSPEQTGRLNRAMDYRTDFYSLGATMYELLTDRPPFVATVAIEIIHDHLARAPEPPHQVNEQVPEALSAIVLKLLAKDPEDRYRSAWGLRFDLEECLTQFDNAGRISPFPLGRQDSPDRFSLPQRIYGREKEMKIVQSARARIKAGSKGIVLAAGPPGVGKTALIKEVFQQVDHGPEYFIYGKSDQMKDHVPYQSLGQALGQLVGQITAQGEERLAWWRNSLLDILGPSSGLLIKVFPDLEKLIGPQPGPDDLPPAEAQNRFHSAMQGLFQTLAQSGDCLVLFLDDLQWMDPASFSLLEVILTTPGARSMLLVGAYRDEEMAASVERTQSLEKLKKAGDFLETLQVLPLNQAEIGQLIGAALNHSPEEARPLAQLVRIQTGGNPLYISEFLKSLDQDQALLFDRRTRTWRWDLSLIYERSPTKDLLGLLGAGLEKMEPRTQEALKLAACFGDRFDLRTLSLVTEVTGHETLKALWPAVRAGLIVPLDEVYRYLESGLELAQETTLGRFKFAHDRFRQAAYELTPFPDRSALHLRLGRLLRKNTPADQWPTKIFDIVNQLNLGRTSIESREGRTDLTDLNLMAGRRAKADSAFETAYLYLQHGLALLDDDSWTRRYPQTLAIYTEAVEAAYLTGRFEEMERLTAKVLDQAPSILDQAKVLEIKLRALISQSKFQEALKIGLLVLRRLGVRLPAHPNKIRMIYEFYRTRLTLAGRPLDQLSDLPALTDPLKQAALNIMPMLELVAYSGAPELAPLIVFAGVRSLVKAGQGPSSANFLNWWGFFLGVIQGDFDRGHQVGLAALKMQDLIRSKEFKTHTMFIVNSMIRHWKEPIRDTLSGLMAAYQSRLESGDVYTAGCALVIHSWHSWLIGRDLSEVVKENASFIEAVKSVRNERLARVLTMIRAAILFLMAENPDDAPWFEPFLDEQTKQPLFLRDKDETGLVFFQLGRLIISLLLQDCSQALEAAAVAERHLDSAVGTPCVPTFYFYDSLARLASWPHMGQAERRRTLRRVASNQKKLKKWANSAPANYAHKFHLVEAERRRRLGQKAEAWTHYQQAIEQAHAQAFLNEEALAHELAADFFREWDLTAEAEAHLRQARYCYLRWGAAVKVNWLDKKYPYLAAESSRVSLAELSRPQALMTETISRPPEAFDHVSAMKAAQAVSSEIHLDSLLSKLMTVVIENAGAERGFLFLKEKDGLTLAARASVGQTPEPILAPIPLREVKDLPLAIIDSVAARNDPVILGDASTEGPFIHDEYVANRKPKSILGLPVLLKGELTGVLYLENNLVSGVFTPHSAELLKIIMSQAAVSIENARLFARIEESEKKYRALFENAIDYQKHLQELSSELALTEERERRQLAVTLHDRIGQNLALALNRLDALKGPIEVASMEAGLETVSDLLVETIHETRSLTLELSPSILYDLGLEAALDWLADHMKERHDLDIEVEDDEQPKPLDTDPAAFLFRSVRELLINVLKHAQVSRARVSIRRQDDNLSITIEDHGRGFPGEVRRRREWSGFGLSSVEEGLRHWGGALDIDSRPGQGTKVTMTMPLRKEL